MQELDNNQLTSARLRAFVNGRIVQPVTLQISIVGGTATGIQLVRALLETPGPIDHLTIKYLFSQLLIMTTLVLAESLCSIQMLTTHSGNSIQ